MEFLDLTEKEEKIGKAIVNAAYNIHVKLGPGLLERVMKFA
ncbi:GxxExxY protein [Litoribacter ruber]|nr:GxxExxY protein [Litoribacter ruber]